ncbi:MAG: hypothetical protein JNM42_08570 [Propionivibrio sp.]|uniref:class I SAM-dependent methyltransferase n=1 Tax=Propionivibrio sp. TaxID=2212460 RepID=UPI001A63916A|nr:class I SAM-dependent methyltransferase [Propionivibrio sp.]MBL8414475.1 hypothetical protein [Propionivibrio sp.]
MSMRRIVGPEILDGLAADDPAARRSRRDLRRVHRAMGTRTILRRALHRTTASIPDNRPLRVLELGAGDGNLMLGVAHALAPAWPRVELTLLDRQALVSLEMIENYARLGWNVVEQVADALEWAASATDSLPNGNEPARWDLIVANLFLHHFEGTQLALLLNSITARSNGFFACEPRRNWISLAGSHLAGLIGAGAVTREDAVLSVHAGFRDKELTTLWPAVHDEWRIHEYSAGLFSHCLHAERVGRP